jgi:quercetin dioxygenase-like cupin family protein
MRRRALLAVAAVAASVVLCQTGRAQQPQIKRTDLLTTDLADLGNKQMHVWIGDIPPGAATGRHSHPTPRFVYVLQGAVVVEMDGKPAETFEAGRAFVEMPNAVHNFRNASTIEAAKAVGVQYAEKGQPLQISGP